MSSFTAGKQQTPLPGVGAMEEQLKDLTDVLREVATEYLLPLFGQHYQQAGIKQRSGVLQRAVTTPGAPGNVLEIHRAGITAGVDYSAVPYARWVFEGRGPVVAQRAKALRIPVGNGQVVFRHSVGAAPARPVIFLTPGEIDAMARLIEQKVTERMKRAT